MNINAFLATSGGRAILATLKGAIAETESAPGNTGFPPHALSEGSLPLRPSPNSHYPDGHIEALQARGTHRT